MSDEQGRGVAVPKSLEEVRIAHFFRLMKAQGELSVELLDAARQLQQFKDADKQIFEAIHERREAHERISSLLDSLVRLLSSVVDEFKEAAL